MPLLQHHHLKLWQFLRIPEKRTRVQNSQALISSEVVDCLQQEQKERDAKRRQKPAKRRIYLKKENCMCYV